MPLVPSSEAPAMPLHLLEADDLPGWLEAADPRAREWVRTSGFKASLGETLVLPGPDGRVAGALFGLGTSGARGRGRFHLALAADRLPAGRYEPVGSLPDALDIELLGWLLADYRFSRYRDQPASRVELVCPEGIDIDSLRLQADAASFAQDLINTPANDMGPEALEAAFVGLAHRFGSEAEVIRGPALLRRNFPLIHAVGAAAAQEPRLLDMSWGRPDAPRVTLVGKGVCFDTGGLNIKPGSSMGLMKKDMGGAAIAMGLAQAIMGKGLDIRLRLLVPAVENAISGPAMRPGDILTSRKGLTVEINNTDAEGRLVLADALALAAEESPELLFSLATLTGAARVALGPDLPAFFADDDALANHLGAAATAVADPLWRLPFWEPYESLIEPGIADLDNAPSGGMAGAITAALFLRRFVGANPGYVHLDLFAWSPTAKPGRPKGGSFQAARAILRLLEERYCPKP